MSDAADVAIVGGGAAGLAAAIFAADSAGPGRRVIVLDGAKTLGAKILVSGGGRCNVTHDVVRADDFNGSRNVVRNVLAAFDAAATVRWFASMGVQLKREPTGKLFPVTDSARTVLGALLDRCRQLGVSIRTGHRATFIRPGEAFEIQHAAGTLAARTVILSAGGRSLPRSGSDGSGWEIASALGHSVTSTYPALVPLVLDPAMFHACVSGIAHDVELSTWVDRTRIDRRTGSLLWTHFGISGPVVMDASRHWVTAHESGQSPQLRCNLLPPDGFEQVERFFLAQTADRPRVSLGTTLAQRLPDRLAGAICAHLKIEPSLTLSQLSREARRALAHGLTELSLPVSGPRGWNYAEVTAGGVPLAEIDFRTMQSRIVPGLYLAGEILDCDGRIGGFNFQWAWATGFLAGRSAARSLA